MKKVTYMEMIRFQDLFTRPERGHKLSKAEVDEILSLDDKIQSDSVARVYYQAWSHHSGCSRFYRAQYKAFWGDPERDPEALATAVREARVSAILQGKAVA